MIEVRDRDAVLQLGAVDGDLHARVLRLLGTEGTRVDRVQTRVQMDVRHVPKRGWKALVVTVQTSTALSVPAALRGPEHCRGP